MSLNASDVFRGRVGLATFGVRKDAALRLLESVEVMDQDAVDEAWTSETSFRVDDIRTGTI